MENILGVKGLSLDGGRQSVLIEIERVLIDLDDVMIDSLIDSHKEIHELPILIDMIGNLKGNLHNVKNNLMKDRLKNTRYIEEVDNKLDNIRKLNTLLYILYSIK